MDIEKPSLIKRFWEWLRHPVSSKLFLFSIFFVLLRLIKPVWEFIKDVRFPGPDIYWIFLIMLTYPLIYMLMKNQLIRSRDVPPIKPRKEALFILKLLTESTSAPGEYSEALERAFLERFPKSGKDNFYGLIGSLIIWGLIIPSERSDDSVHDADLSGYFLSRGGGVYLQTKGKWPKKPWNPTSAAKQS